MSRASCDRGDRGAVIVLTAMLLVGLLGLSAIVVDLGVARMQRRDNQSAADLSASAAGAWLSGRGGPTPESRPRSACEAALETAKANLDQFPASATIDCSSLPATGTVPDCHGGTPPQTIVASGTTPFDLTVTYPVRASQITESAFSGGLGANDGSPCERMAVTIGHERSSFFAGVFGVSLIDTASTAVVRGSVDQAGDRVPAFLILERSRCRVLTNSVGGSGNLGIVVTSPTPTQGGAIHTDTDASACGGTSTQYAIYGNALSGGGTSITVEDSSGGDPGTISSYAVTAGSSRAAAVYPGGISHPATAGTVISRQPVDNRYNPSIRPAIRDLHTDARARVLMSAATAASNGYTVLGCGDRNGTWTDPRVFVDCSAWSPNDVRLPNATDLVTTGKVDIGNNRLLHLPVVERMYVRGCPGCTGSGAAALAISGELYVNTGSEPIGSATCDDRTGPGAGGTTTNVTTLVAFGSPLDISGEAYLCQTTVYLGAESASYSRQASTSGPPNCAPTKPCPVTGAAPGSGFAVSGYVEWTAPNQITGTPSASDPFEDLALWTESSDVMDIKSGGVLITSGVYFAPNAHVEFRSPASGLPRNSQLIFASFNMLQGTLKLQPVPEDAVPIATPGAYGLIR